MKLQHLSTCIGLIASSAIALSVEPARAFNFTAGSDLGSCGILVDNTTTPLFKAFIDDDQLKSCTTGDGFTLTASDPTDGVLQGKLVDKDGVVKGVGISVPVPGKPQGNAVPAEVQFGELLTATLDEAREIESFALSFLYLDPVFGDKVNEVAEVTVNGGETGTLTILDTTTAEWKFGAITKLINAIDPSEAVEGGYYSIDDPFGDIVVSSLSFTAPDVPGIDAPRDSDYALVAIEKRIDGMEDVPEPATLLGLSVVGGLMVASRRKKSSR